VLPVLISSADPTALVFALWDRDEIRWKAVLAEIERQ
jgi:hypothetical protein